MFVSQISTQAIATITPFVTLGLTLGFIAYAIAIIRGAVDMPVMDFLARSLRIAIIVGVALAGGLYQSQIAGAIVELPNSLAVALISNPTEGAGAASIIDVAAGKGFDAASRAFEQSSFFSADGLLYGIFGIIIILATAVVVSIGGAFILLAKVALALLAGLGPIFIVCFLWQPLSRFFDLWIGQVLNYVLLVVLFSALFGLMMDIYGGYVAGVKFESGVNVAYSLGGAIILSIAMVLVLLQLPGIAGALAGGAALGYMHELRAIRGGAASVSRASGMSAAGRQASRAGGWAASKAGGSIKTGASKAYGYFKGRAA
ncbi:type IV secretion system protein (plasmid) [Pseudomonas fragi]|uniref:type IV secretion system protein n=1 Tax=Pseudomonas fragi TaxID=296 RepID=UPI0021BEA3D4|nr:type IV secretion system protein [Pseudomonas fragi]UXL41032.1 type IV secretion system protein [Pseudomonas fragi]